MAKSAQSIQQTNGDSNAQASKPGDIFLFYHATGFSRLITFFTRSPYYHVGICVGGSNAIEARPRGVKKRDLAQVKNRSHYLTILAPEGKGEAALEWAKSKLGDGYDDVGALVLIFERIFIHLHINHAPGDRFTCGEFVARAFLEAGVNLFPDRKPEDVLPKDFAKLLPDSRQPQKK